VEPLGGRDFLYLETISNISWKTVIPSLKLPSFPSNGRRIVYLHCCDNYRADTVLHLFIEGVRQLGLPSRVRGDRGGENIGVARFMVEHALTGPGRGSFVAGCSVHSQRIERLWLDVFNQCTVVFYNLFYALEEEGVLDCANEVHLFCLHYVYTSRINRALNVFKQAWNLHPLSSKGNLSPCQLNFYHRM
jgi:hypothetical protein